MPYTQPRIVAMMVRMAEITIDVNFFLLIVCLLYVYLPRTRQLCGLPICYHGKARFFKTMCQLFFVLFVFNALFAEKLCEQCATLLFQDASINFYVVVEQPLFKEVDFASCGPRLFIVCPKI